MPKRTRTKIIKGKRTERLVGSSQEKLKKKKFKILFLKARRRAKKILLRRALSKIENPTKEQKQALQEQAEKEISKMTVYQMQKLENSGQ